LTKDPSGPVYLKPRWAVEPVLWEELPDDELVMVSADTALNQAEFVALDVETTGNSPFLVLEIGAERFSLERSLSLFDTLVDCRAPINTYARRRHQISRHMLEGAPGFADARRAFLHFARGAALVEHSHDAFDTYLIGRGLRRPLEHPVLDTSTLARVVLGLPSGQTPGLARVVAELGVDASPAHAALSDAQATALVFRELVRRGQERFGWKTVGELQAILVRPDVDRSALESRRRRGDPARQRLPELRRGRRRTPPTVTEPPDPGQQPPTPPVAEPEQPT
jgi:DNA polymerase III alpha subunit (gram-positive type)